MIYAAAAQDKPSHLYSLAAAAARTVCGPGISNSIVTSSQDKDKLSTEQMNLSYPRPGQMWSVGWRSLPGDMKLQYIYSLTCTVPGASLLPLVSWGRGR